MLKVLIVEDEKNIVFTLEVLLKDMDVEYEIAVDGIQALNKAEIFKPDLVLLDIVIPKMNGFLVCEALKSNPITRNISVVFISAKSQKEDIERAYEVGGEDYLVKPFNSSQIIEIIERYRNKTK
ncbi:MAG: response regulator [Kosmotogaceae bacterium]